MEPKDRLKIIIESSTPVVAIETVEEARALDVIRQAAAELQMPVFEWSVADGLFRSGQKPGATDLPGAVSAVNPQLVAAGAPPMKVPPMPTGQQSPSGSTPSIYNTKEAAQVLAHLQTLTVEAVFVLKDLHRHLSDPVAIRLLREVAYLYRRDRRTIVITAPAVDIPPELQNEIEFLDLPLPGRERLRQIIEEQFQRLSATRTLRRTLNDAALLAMAANLSGLTEMEAERAVAEAIITRGGLVAEAIADVLDQKREMLRHTGMLEFVPATQDMGQIAGLDNLKSWLMKRRMALDPSAQAAGLDAPKGVIVMGVQGCGKSMSVRCIGGEWGLPLVKFDASAIYDKYMGETEKRIQKLFRVAEQLAPCVLWIDELEKVFAGSGADAAGSDAGTSSRMLGAFLSWMQDRKSPVFVAATSNNVGALPPELIRKGRFDELFFVDLPNAVERQAIFRIHLAKRKQDPAKFDLARLAAASSGFSGAEIESAVQGAMYAAFAQKQPLSTEMVAAELAGSVPLSQTRAEDLEQLREWARTRAVAASAPVASAAGSR